MMSPRPRDLPLRLRGIALASLFGCLVWSVVGAPPRALAADNPIVAENQLPGSSGWRSGSLIADDATGQIKAYASTTSVSQNQSITLYVTVNPEQSFVIDFYRMGWYGGLGGRLRLHAGPIPGIRQSDCQTDPTTGLIACAWTPSYTLSIPGDWTSGMYFAHLTNAQGYENYVPFVVKDGRPAAFLYHQPVLTDQAYNNYPDDGRTGKSLYGYNSYGAPTVYGDARAVKVSFDRPYAGMGIGGFFAFEVELVRWLERSGYDVTYTTSIDTHVNGAALRNSKAFLSPAHDEYWSKEMFDAAEAARDAGVSLAFFGADADSGQVRLEPSAAGIANRVVVDYRNPALDPVQGPTTSSAWRYPPINRPEQTLRGVQFTADVPWGKNADYVVTNSSHWAYAGTGFKDGDIVPGIVGYEMDRYMSNYPPPNSADWTLLSRSPFTNAAGPDNANSSIYRAPSGAWVFSSGTMSWSWALDNFDHLLADARIQRTTANILGAFLSGPQVARSLKLTAGPAVTAGSPFNVAVTAVDGLGGTVTSYNGKVHFSSSDASAGVVLPPDVTLTGGQGTFSATLMAAGPQTITARDTAAPLVTGTVSVDVAAVLGSLDVTVPATATAGQPFTLTVTAKDTSGKPFPAYSGTVRFTSSDTSTGVVLPADSTLPNGRGTFSVTLVKAGTQTITATDAVNRLSKQATIAVKAAPASRLKVVASTATPTAGTTFSLTVSAEDPFGNIDQAYAGQVHFSSTDTAAGVVLPSDSPLVSGQGTFQATLVRAGSQTINAVDRMTPAVAGSATLTVRPAAARTVTLAAPSAATVGQAFTIRVTLADRFGNQATGYRGRVRFSTSDISPLVGLPGSYTFTAGDAGFHAFSATLWTPPSQTITVTDVVDPTLTATSRVTVRLPLPIGLP
jgi:hypothetical protein